MFLLRIVAILAVIGVGVGVALFLITGNRSALRFALQLLKWAIILALLVFALFALERLAIIV